MNRWTGPFLWPLVAIHMALLPNGKVMIADYFQDNSNPLHNPKVYIWDPDRPNFVEDPSAWGYQVANSHNNVFCAGHCGLADGRLFWAGGHINNFIGPNRGDIWNATSNQWSVTPNMTYARWYPTCTALPNGTVFVSSGYITNGTMANVPEVYNPLTNTFSAKPTAFNEVTDYPFNFVAPNGKLFYAGPEIDTQFLDINTWQWQTPTMTSPWAGLYAGSAVMYDTGKILKTGGSNFEEGPSVATAATIYLDPAQTNPLPQWTAIAPMAFARYHHNLTALPDGTVLCTGGNRVHLDDSVSDPEPVLFAELFTPGAGTSGTWSTIPEPMSVGRWYHSTALLLPNAKVIVAGGNNRQNAELFTPPYFDGITDVMQPAITAAPASVTYGSQFQISATPGAGTFHNKVSLIKLGAVTHAFNQDQRFMWLNFNPSTKRVTAPANANLAPPGYYMLFVLSTIDHKLVPSRARIIKISSGLQKSIAQVDGF